MRLLSEVAYCTSLFAAPAVPESALPIGMEKEDGSTQLIPIEPSEWEINVIMTELRRLTAVLACVEYIVQVQICTIVILLCSCIHV